MKNRQHVRTQHAARMYVRTNAIRPRTHTAPWKDVHVRTQHACTGERKQDGHARTRHRSKTSMRERTNARTHARENARKTSMLARGIVGRRPLANTSTHACTASEKVRLYRSSMTATLGWVAIVYKATLCSYSPNVSPMCSIGNLEMFYPMKFFC